MDGEIHARVAVAVFVDLDAHLVEEFVVRYEGQELLDDHGLRRIGGLVLPQIPGRSGRGLVRDHGMHGVVEVLDEHLPVAVVQVAQCAADDFETARRRAVRQIVDRGERLAEIVARNSAPPRLRSREHETAMDRHGAHRSESERRRRFIETGAGIARPSAARCAAFRRAGRSIHDRDSAELRRSCRRWR